MDAVSVWVVVAVAAFVVFWTGVIWHQEIIGLFKPRHITERDLRVGSRWKNQSQGFVKHRMLTRRGEYTISLFPSGNMFVRHEGLSIGDTVSVDLDDVESGLDEAYGRIVQHHNDPSWGVSPTEGLRQQVTAINIKWEKNLGNLGANK